ncbi:MAG: DUF885 domain-containing protein [Myxococcales bacterium]|nr:DUF885 domain-containing protein [Myxococcales bacterium]
MLSHVKSLVVALCLCLLVCITTLSGGATPASRPSTRQVLTNKTARQTNPSQQVNQRRVPLAARPKCLIVKVLRGKKMSPEQRLERLFQDFWSWMLCEEPLLAEEWSGDTAVRWLPEVSEAAMLRRAAGYRLFLKRLKGVHGLSKEARIQADILALLLNNWLGEVQYKNYLLPINQRENFISDLAETLKRARYTKREEAEAGISKLRDFGRYTDEHLAVMRQGLREGYTLPRVVAGGIDKGIALYLKKDASQSVFYRPFLHLPKTWSEAERKRTQKAASQAITAVVMPSIQRFLTFWRKEYAPRLRDSIAASKLPKGSAFYRHRIRYYTTLPLTAEAIHARGLAEVKRIRTEMQAILRSVRFKGDFGAFLRFLRTDPRFYVKTPQQLLKEVSYVLKRMDGQLPRLFGRLPRTPYGIREIPMSIAPRTTPAFYWPLSGDGRKAGFYYVNTYNLKSRPLYEIEALSFHEAVPGHHLQIALQQEQKSLPMFRRAFRFTVFVEGWALYAERLGLEVGFYRDPYSNFGRLTYEMWRACRLVVDTGMHAKGWSRQQAIDFMARHTALSLHNIQTEVDRYIAWPGQALAYKIGEMTIRGLRKEAEKALGRRFSIRRFHDALLQNGSVPMPVLSRQMRAWIQQQL